MPPDPLEGQNNFPQRFSARNIFLGQALPPQAEKPSDGPEISSMQSVDTLIRNVWRFFSGKELWQIVCKFFLVHRRSWRR